MSSEKKLSDWKKIYTLIIEDDCAIISKYKGTETEVTVPDYVGQYKVTKIGKKAFAKKPITKVILPETIEEIGECAFENCAQLSEIVIPDSVGKIGEYAFSWSGVKEIIIPSRITKIETGAFDICRKLEQITFPDGLTEIGDSAFGGCSELSNIHLPNSLQIIGGSAFSGCLNLQTMVIPASVKQIGESAFAATSSDVKRIVLQGKPKIGKFAFSYAWDRCDDLFLEHVRGLEIDAPEDMAVYPYLMAWDKAFPAMICGILRRAIREEFSVRKADLFWLAKKVMSSAKVLLPEFCKEITAEELAFMDSQKLITVKNADVLMGLLKENIALTTQLLEYINKNITPNQREKAEDQKVNAAVSRVRKQNKALEKAVQEYSEKTPEQIAKEWRTEKRADGCWIAEYLGEDLVIVVPGFVGTERVVGIQEDAMRASCPEFDDQKSAYNKKMYKTKAVIISEGITSVEENACAGCVYRTNAVLPDSWQNIAPNAFAACHKVTIHAPAGSYAESYAIRNSIPFVAE